MKNPKKDPFEEKFARMVAEQVEEDLAAMEERLVGEAKTARKAQKIREVAYRATSYKECLIAALEYHGWRLDDMEQVYTCQRGERTDRIDPFFLETFSQDPDSLYDRFFGDGVCKMAQDAWDLVSPSVKVINALAK